MICDAWDLVVVPFPFTDRTATKRRPALALSAKPFNRHGHTVLAMITSVSHRPWPGDTQVSNGAAVGLSKPSMVRLKIFTLDNRLIVRRLGALAVDDRWSVSKHLGTCLDLQTEPRAK